MGLGFDLLLPLQPLRLLIRPVAFGLPLSAIRVGVHHASIMRLQSMPGLVFSVHDGRVSRSA